MTYTKEYHYWEFAIFVLLGVFGVSDSPSDKGATLTERSGRIWGCLFAFERSLVEACPSGNLGGTTSDH